MGNKRSRNGYVHDSDSRSEPGPKLNYSSLKDPQSIYFTSSSPLDSAAIMDPDQTFYYPITDPLQNLNLKVTLRRVNKTKASVSGKENKAEKKNKKSLRYDDEDDEILVIEKNLEWQEKVFGPREIAILSPDSNER